MRVMNKFTRELGRQFKAEQQRLNGVRASTKGTSKVRYCCIRAHEFKVTLTCLLVGYKIKINDLIPAAMC